MKKILLLFTILMFVIPGVLSWDVNREVSNQEVTITITPDAGELYYYLTETFSAGVAVLTKPSFCTYMVAQNLMNCDIEDLEELTFTYSTSGNGDVTGEITGGAAPPFTTKVIISNTIPTAVEDPCGNDVCQPEIGETCSTCAADCDCIGGDSCIDDVCVAPSCGDGTTDIPGEACDDGNTNDGDGCSANCGIEDGFDCVIKANGDVCYNICYQQNVPSELVGSYSGASICAHRASVLNKYPDNPENIGQCLGIYKGVPIISENNHFGYLGSPTASEEPSTQLFYNWELFCNGYSVTNQPSSFDDAVLCLSHITEYDYSTYSSTHLALFDVNCELSLESQCIIGQGQCDAGYSCVHVTPDGLKGECTLTSTDPNDALVQSLTATIADILTEEGLYNSGYETTLKKTAAIAKALRTYFTQTNPN